MSTIKSSASVKSHPTMPAAAGSQDLGSLLMVLMMAIKRYVGSVGVDHGLSNVQFVTLAYLVPDEGCTMSELSMFLGCDASNVTGIVDGLEAKGLLSRHEKPGDRRVKMVRLEPAGFAIRKEALGKAAAFIEKDLLRPLGASDLRQFAQLLHIIVDGLPPVVQCNS